MHIEEHFLIKCMSLELPGGAEHTTLEANHLAT